MNIIIVGCGKVGIAIANQLYEEGHQITMVDNQPHILSEALSKLDCMGLCGSGTSYKIQTEAGIGGCDLLIAVTGMDEVNLLCCLMARKAGHSHTIARVRNPEYYAEIEYIREELGLSLAINPELAASYDIFNLIQIPAATSLDSFAKGRMKMISLDISEDSVLCSEKIMGIPKIAGARLLICAILRKGGVIIPNGNDIIEAGDRISLLIEPEHIQTVLRHLGMDYKPVKNVMVVGGGKIAYYLAKALLEAKIRVKIIEVDKAICEHLSELLPEAAIVCADASDQTILIESGLESMDAFVSLTNFDEENILLSLATHKLCSAHIITKINKLNIQGLIDDLPIGSIVSPKQLTCEHILQYVRSMQNSYDSHVEAVYLLADGHVEALEFAVNEPSDVTDVPLMQLRLKPSLLVCSILRGRKVIIPGGHDRIQPGDTVIVATTNKGLDRIEDIIN